MANISRPFQVALAAVAVLALVWVVALHRPSSSSSTSQPSPAPSAAASTAAQTAAANGSPASGATGGKGKGVYHGSAPGVEGLTRAIAKANGAVATSQQNARQLQEKSEQASSSSSSTSTASQAPIPAHSTARAVAPAKPAAKSAPATKTQPAPKLAPHRSATAPALAHQHLVEAELKQGKTVALLFWSAKGSDDVAVRNSMRELAKSDHGLVMHLTAPSQVASFGTITRGVQVYGTPTILIVAKHGRTIVLTGLQDAFAIRQAVSEARHA
jgi:hypothetical protein